MSELWRIELLGGLRAVSGRTVISRFRTQKTAALLAYLALGRGRSHPREALIDMLWPDCALDAGRNSLSQALCSLRHQLEPPGTPAGAVLAATRAAVQLDPRSFATDVAELDLAVRSADRAASDLERADALQRAVELYQGELVPGLDQPWAISERERLRESFLRAVHKLVAHLERGGDREEAIRCAHRALEIDPLREEARRDLMRLLTAAGHPAAALHQYRELERLLARELGAAPSPETRALAVEVERRAVHAPPPPSAATQIARQVRPPGLSAGTVTFLAAEPGEILRPLLERHGGHETPGGSLLAAFARPSEAVACAVAAQRKTPAHLRAALDTGEARWAAGSYRGAVLERAASLFRCARAGQILCSEETATLLRRDLDPSLRLLDLGRFRVHRASSPARLFQVQDLTGPPSEPRAPEAERAWSGNLPVQLTRFVGRRKELAAIEALLLAEGSRLVTLTGAGGTGKTRLALEAAERLLEPLQGGVWFVPLGDLDDARLLPGAVAAALGLERAESSDSLGQVVEALSGERKLLLLDNMEQLGAEGGQWVRRLLERARPLRCLVTSRRRLALHGERLVRVSPLPAPAGPEAPERMAAIPSVQLFVDRAQAALPDFQVTRANAAAVATLCRRLEGLPLALELAAARAQVLTPAQMVERLPRRFDLLAGKHSGAPARHRTLRAALDWSYQLLSPELRQFLARLSVFRGGWTLEAAEDVCREPLALDRLAELEDWSLIVAAPGPHGLRFGMLETIREYAREQLGARDLADLEERRARHLIEFAERAEPALAGPDQSAWLDRVALEHDNLRAALEWARGRGRAETGLRIAAAISRFWFVRGHFDEGRRWLEELLARARKRTAARGNAAWAAGILARAQGDTRTARAFLEKSLAIRRALRDRPGVAQALNNLGLVAWSQSDYPAARRLFEEALALRRRLQDRTGVARSLSSLGLVAAVQGDLSRAKALLLESEKLFRALGDRLSLAHVLGNLGNVARDEGDLARARAFLEQGLAIFREVGDRRGAAYVLADLGTVAQQRGAGGPARAALDESLATFREMGEKQGVAVALAGLADAACAAGEIESARALYRESLAATRALGDRAGMVRALEKLARVALAAGEGAEAARLMGAAQAARAALGMPVAPGARREREAQVDALRSEFSAEWRSGGRATLERAAAWGLGERAGRGS